MNNKANGSYNDIISSGKLVKYVRGADYLKKVVVVEERSVVLQLSLMGLLHLILPLLFQFCDTLKATQEVIRQTVRMTFLSSVKVGSLILGVHNRDLFCRYQY